MLCCWKLSCQTFGTKALNSLRFQNISWNCQSCGCENILREITTTYVLLMPRSTQPRSIIVDLVVAPYAHSFGIISMLLLFVTYLDWHRCSWHEHKSGGLDGHHVNGASICLFLQDLFSNYISDLSTSLSCRLFEYADDVAPCQATSGNENFHCCFRNLL